MAVPVITAAATAHSATATLTLAMPTVTDGQLLLAFVGHAGTGVTGPAGWTEKTEFRIDHDGDSGFFTVWQRTATASEPSSYAWSFPESGTSNRSAGFIAEVDATNGFGPYAITSHDDSSEDGVSYPAITTLGANRLVLRVVWNKNGSRTLTVAPAGCDLVARATTGATEGPQVYVHSHAQASAGDAGVKTGTWSNASRWSTLTFALAEQSADVTAPTVPTGLNATATGQTTASLTWTASTDAVGVTGYRIYQGGVLFDTSATNSYNATNLTPNTLYSFTVSAFDAQGNESAQSAADAVTTDPVPDTTAPPKPPPVGVSNISSDQATVTWQASGASDLSHYLLYVNGAPEGPTVFTVRTLTGLSAGTSHTVRVSAVDSSGNESVQSDPVTFVTLGSPIYLFLPPERNIGANYLYTSRPVEKALMRHFAPRNLGVAVLLTGGVATEHLAVTTDQMAAADYAYLGGYRHIITSAEYDLLLAEGYEDNLEIISEPVENPEEPPPPPPPPVDNPPTAPTQLQSTAVTQTTISLLWQAATDDNGIDHYNVYVDGVLGGSTPDDATTYVVSGLTADTEYDLTVKAVDTDDQEGPASNTLTETTDAIVVTPTDFTITLADDDTDQTASWTSQLAAIPDGSSGSPSTITIQTTNGGLARVDGRMSVSNRHWLEFDGRATGFAIYTNLDGQQAGIMNSQGTQSARQHLRIAASTNITFRGIDITGPFVDNFSSVNPNYADFTAKWSPEHAVIVQVACDNILIEDVSYRWVGGDGINISGATDNQAPCTNITFRRVNGEWTARQAIALVHVEGCVIEDCTFTHGGRSGLDIEPNGDGQYVEDAVLRRISFGQNLNPVTMSGKSANAQLLAQQGKTHRTKDIVLEDITCTDSNSSGHQPALGNRGGHGLRITRFIDLRYRGGAAITLGGWDGAVVVEGCTITAGNSSATSVAVRANGGTATYTITGNTFNGAPGTEGFDQLYRRNYAATAAAATNVLTRAAHGQSNGDTVTIDILSGTSGISVGTSYFVVNATTDTFQLSTSSGGPAVDLVGDGTVYYYSTVTQATVTHSGNVWNMGASSD